MTTLFDDATKHLVEVDLRALEKPLDDILSGEVATLPLAALAEYPPEGLPKIIGRINMRLIQEVSRNEAAVLWTAFIVLFNLKLRHPAERPSQLLQRIHTITDARRSATDQPVLAEEKAEG